VSPEDSVGYLYFSSQSLSFQGAMAGGDYSPSGAPFCLLLKTDTKPLFRAYSLLRGKTCSGAVFHGRHIEMDDDK
jgi:hypothetical protein